MRAAAAKLGAMIQAQAQRTLVKSPPELWSELSDEQTLRAHLAGLGEVRITRREPERRIEWQASGACGSIEIEPSGWGTRVTLSLERAEHGAAERAESGSAPGAEGSDGGQGSQSLKRQPQARQSTSGAQALPVKRAEEESAAADGPAPETPAGSEPEWPALRPRSIRARIGSLLGIASRRKGQRPESQASRTQDDGSLPDPARSGSVRAEPAALKLGLEFDRVSAAVLAPSRPHGASPQPTRTGDPGEEAAGSDAAPPAHTGAAAPPGQPQPDAAQSAQELLSALLDRLGEARHRPFSRA